MTETSKLDEPLSDVDYDELETFLGSNVVPQDCMDLEMLDGFLTAIVSGPELIQPSEWLPVLWSDSQRSVTPVFQNNEQAERILSLVLRLQQSIRRTLAESPTRFKPLLYHAEAEKDERSPPEASAWCEGFMTGVLPSTICAWAQAHASARLGSSSRGHSNTGNGWWGVAVIDAPALRTTTRQIQGCRWPAASATGSSSWRW